ncbi:Ubiquitin homeostasis protein lub1 [Ceratocystis platani]|uniref:Ubiquitin homeostasis protein lub1 n=1 Tax=Ceratocystis fimbriata f. sp. platani TaxID=88771 RepID=A0A0F8BJZ6_CERFI|nr:Ubiquitin homeostasis protein lub1 [Ceratocystis platani]
MAFQLSAQLIGHESDVRPPLPPQIPHVRDAIFPSSSLILTASRDGTVRRWQRTSDSAFEAFLVSQGSEYVNSVTYIPPSIRYPNGLAISGGKDTIIDVRSPKATPENNAERMLIGHGHNICTLDVSPKGTYVISGGWDCQARVWKVEKWETEFMLQEHELSVWAVLAYDENTVITGCADKKIRIFDLRNSVAGDVRPASTIHTPDIVRALCRLPSGHPTGAEIACACSDGVIRLYKLDGTMISELIGHDSYIYSLAILPSGEIVSSGEDRTVKIWSGSSCIQTITHPAISVWSVAACAETGDIVTAASDNVARVFTRSPERLADAETLREFKEAVSNSSIPQKPMGGINKEKVPGTEFLTTKMGKKDGQVQVIKHDDGSLAAYTWSMMLQKWEHVGAVVDSAGSSGRKQEYNGQQYDFVFDVDIDDSKPPLKLPFNLSQNVFEAARKFLEDNELPITYLDNVVKFLETNTQGATIGEAADSSSSHPDPMGSDARYHPGDENRPSPAQKTLPQTDYIALLNGKFDNIFNKIHTVNKNLISAGNKEFALNPAEEQVLSELRPCIEGNTPIQATSLEIVIKVASRWNYPDVLPGLDLLRYLVRYPETALYKDSETRNIIDLVISSSLNVPSGQEINVNCIVMAIRCLSNLFTSAEGVSLMTDQFTKALEFLEKVAGISGTAIGASNRHVQIASTTTLINLAVLGAKTEVSLDVRRRMVNILGIILKDNTDGEVLYRGLVALGTMVSHKTDIAQDWRPWVKSVVERCDEARVKSLGRECLNL